MVEYVAYGNNKELKQRQQQRQQEREKKAQYSCRFNKQNNNFARASCYFVHFFTVHWDFRFGLGIGGFHAVSGDTNNNGEMNKCWWTKKTS